MFDPQIVALLLLSHGMPIAMANVSIIACVAKDEPFHSKSVK